MLYVGRVLHLPLSEITVTRSLMQVSVRVFSISIMKIMSQNKTYIAVCPKKPRKIKGTQLTKSDSGRRRT